MIPVNRQKRPEVSCADRLVEALLTLGAEVPWNRLTVAALCRRAGVHRSTFYAHFESADDVLNRGLPRWFDGWVGPGGRDLALGHVRLHGAFYRRALDEPAVRRSLEAYLDAHLRASGEAEGARRAFLVGGFLGLIGFEADRATSPRRSR